jgi:type IV secretory pathway TrbD component
MSIHTRHPWRRLAAICLGVLAGAAVAAVVAMALSVWIAAAIGVLLGEAIATGLELWDDRWFPDRLVTFEAGVR